MSLSERLLFCFVGVCPFACAGAEGEEGEETLPKRLIPVGLSLGAEVAIEVAMEENKGALRFAEESLVLFERGVEGGE